MFRKALDVATKVLEPDPEIGKLFHRIEALARDGRITSDMKDWAHEIRDVGNDAVHEAEPFSEKDTKDLQRFTELFLMYAFTLPGMLAERRDEDNDAGAPRENGDSG